MVKHTYTVKSTADGGLITKAFAQERQYFSPFNVKGGNSRMLVLYVFQSLANKLFQDCRLCMT